MKTKTKTLYLFFFLSLFLVAILPAALVVDVRADVTREQSVVKYDWLYTDLTDPNPDDKLRYSIGGYDLSSFENLGIYQQDESAGEVIFAARATFGFEINAYTAVNVYDAYPELDTDATQSYQFLYIKYFNPWPFVSSEPRYYTTFSTVDLGETFNPNDFGEEFAVRVGLNPDFQNFGGKYIQNIKIDSSEYQYKVKTVEVSNVESGACGTYEDEYTDQEVKTVEMNVQKMGEDAPNDQYLNDVTDAELGVWIAGTPRTTTVQNSIMDTNPKGTIFNNREVGEYTLRDRVQMRPQIDKVEQSVRVREMAFEYCKFWHTHTTYWGPTTKKSPTEGVPDLTRSAHVYNSYIHKEYEANVILLATMKLDYEEYESALSDPYLSQGNWVWDSEVGGSEEVSIVSEQAGSDQIIDAIADFLFGGIFGQIILPILILIGVLIGIYAFIKLGIPLIKRKIEKR
jgi:hypothetical protein